MFGRRSTTAAFEWLVVGLGNPGKEYARSRHNVGQDTVELLARRHGTQLKGGRYHSLVGETRLTSGLDTPRVVLAVPLTFMNESGRAVAALMRRYELDADQLIVVHDELDLEPGMVRIKSGGGLAGHNGLKSIVAHIKTQDFVRVRIGVGKPPDPKRGANHVLRPVPAGERSVLDQAEDTAADVVETIVGHGVDTAMMRYHAR